MNTGARKKVLLTFPTSPANPYLHKHVVFASWRIMADQRYDITPMIPSHNPLENNLNKIVKEFIAGDWDFWLSIDSDNPPFGNPLDDVALDLDIIGFPTPVWYYDGDESKKGERPIYYNALMKPTDGRGGYIPLEPSPGLHEVEAIGGGCFLVARRVFEHPDMKKGAFLRIYDDEGIVDTGNDIAFSQRAKASGFKIWADFDRPCRHFNEIELNEVVAAFKRLYEDVT